MLNRWIGIVCLLFMLCVNSALFVRDVLPDWYAGDPPELEDLARGVSTRRNAQVGIFNAENQMIGRSWTITEMRGEFLSVTSKTMLHPIMLPNGAATPQVRIDTDMHYRQADGLLSDLTMSMHGLPTSVLLRGEYMPPDEFACSWRVGPTRGGAQGSFVLDAEATRAMGDVLRPFSRLSGLYVGRTWRLQLLNPVMKILPGLRGSGLLDEPEIVQVTRTETIRHRGETVEAFVVEARRMRAWVAPNGTVLRQEVELPLLGKLVMREEAFNAGVYEEARLWRREP